MPVLKRKPSPKTVVPTWPDQTELVALELELQPQTDFALPCNYTTQFHSWFLDQVRRIDPILSAHLHDGQSEKPFTLSELKGSINSNGRSLQFSPNQPYQWTITALSKPVVHWMVKWLQKPPSEITLRTASLTIKTWSIAQPPTTYAKLLKSLIPQPPTLTLSFISPTSFRRKGSHFPLPLPFNIFHNYLRRWNDFSGQPVDQDSFLDWIDASVAILRHQLRSMKVSAGKSGSVTGFTGSVQFGLTPKAQQQLEFVQLFITLGQLAPYCGTGAKTTFGLGETTLAWVTDVLPSPPSTREILLAERIEALTQQFTTQRKRTGGDRAATVAQTWATILARRELGEGLVAIAQDLHMPYETVKTYVKLARRALN
jgi:CRISPR-associated endoribonuclease Cas6